MKYVKDLRGYLFLFIRLITLNFFSSVSTLICKMVFALKGVDLGRKNTFYGITKTVRVPLSKIKIGDGNTFRSDESSNPIGINHRCILSTRNKDAIIEIGDNSGLSGVVIRASEKIVIGNNVLIGANAIITDADGHPERRPTNPKPVIINDNVWLGMNVIVLKGVEIGRNSIIGANSVVTGSIPANVIAAGNPCRVLKELKNGEEKQ